MISIRDLLRISIRQVFRQRKRSLAIIFAIALGSSGLITIPSMGDQVKKNLNRDLDLLGGATVIKISFEDFHNKSLDHKDFSPSTIEAIRSMQGVDKVTVSSALPIPTTIRVGRGGKFAYIVAIDADYMDVTGMEVVRGRNVTAKEVNDKERVCLIGSVLSQYLFGEFSPIGRAIQVDDERYTVVGVLGGLRAGQRKEYVLIPITTITARSPHMKILWNRLIIRCKSWDDVPVVAQAIYQAVKSNQDPAYLRVDVMKEQLERLNAIIWWVQVFIFLSIGATLVLGGFGIWNGMMSSVTARTREIGLKKAMGASNLDIMSQFLLEALVMSLSAGVLGVGISRLGVVIISKYLEAPIHEPTFIYYTGVSILFTMLLGIVAGFYPAYRASKMDVVTALRYE